jgi:hypothetical protein
LSNWIKIGVPILVVLLLIITAVSITLAVTKENSVSQVAVDTYRTDAGPIAPGSALCPNCPGYGDSSTNTDTGLQGDTQTRSCCVTNSQNTNTSTVQRGCCGAR